MENNIWLYSINFGKYCGVVIADYREKAVELVRSKYPTAGAICVWNITDDMQYHGDLSVVECHGV